MGKTKMVILVLVGVFFLLLGLYFRIYDPAKSDTYEYLGIGTLIGALLYSKVFQKYKEVASLILGLFILHTGVVLLFQNASNQKIIGLLVFTAGIIVALNSGFSDYLKRRKVEK